MSKVTMKLVGAKRHVLTSTLQVVEKGGTIDVTPEQAEAMLKEVVLDKAHNEHPIWRKTTAEQEAKEAEANDKGAAKPRRRGKAS